MSTQQYRLLNVGELMQSGDEWLTFNTWRPVCVPYRYVCSSVVRRPLAPTGWIAIKDRKPEFPCLLGIWSDSGHWQQSLTSGWVELRNWAYWAKPPPPPPQPDPVEQAWEKANTEASHWTAKAAFLAGWKARGE
jgi:hypothetical protein